MNNKYWEEEIETMPQEDLRHLQLNRLKKRYVWLPMLLIIKKFSKNMESLRILFRLSMTFRNCHSLQKPI